MIDDDQDFSMDVEDPAPTDEPAAPAPPRVVIEYRDRGFPSLLIPPLLLLLSVLVILASRRETPILAPPPAPVVSQSETTPAVEPATPGDAPGPTVAGTDPAPASHLTREMASVLPELPDLDELMPSTTANPVKTLASVGRHEEPDRSPVLEAKAEAPAAEKALVSGDPGPEATPKPVARVNKIDRPLLLEDQAPAPVVADPPPAVSKEQVLDEIREEATRKAAEIRRIEDLKPQVRVLEVGRMMKKAEANRVPFHKALKELVKARRPEIGRDIESLCNEYGRETVPEIRAQINKILGKTYARATLKTKVEMMRAWGLPEPMVFDYVANDASRLVGARGGPKDGDEVGLRAARILLSMPPGTTAGRSVAGSVPVPGSAPGQRPH